MVSLGSGSMLGERHVAIAALLCGALGVLLLLLLHNAVEPREISIRQINASMVGTRVSVEGKIEWVIEKDSFVLFLLGRGAKIKAIKFAPTKNERALAKKDSFVRVVGKVQLYRNEVEIVAEEIRQW
jgi:DNA/RNA endonuclease YhcR with UshA esterase domain